MGLMPAGAGNPFTKLDRQSVVGLFKSVGSRDQDVLYSHKQHLLAQPKQLKLLGIILMVGGGFFTVTVMLAFIGIPLGLFGWWVWRFGSRNVVAVEEGFADFVAAAPN